MVVYDNRPHHSDSARSDAWSLCPSSAFMFHGQDRNLAHIHEGQAPVSWPDKGQRTTSLLICMIVWSWQELQSAAADLHTDTSAVHTPACRIKVQARLKTMMTGALMPSMPDGLCRREPIGQVSTKKYKTATSTESYSTLLQQNA